MSYANISPRNHTFQEVFEEFLQMSTQQYMVHTQYMHGILNSCNFNQKVVCAGYIHSIHIV